MSLRPALCLCVPAVLLAPPLGAQAGGRTIDEGTFVVQHAGTAAGREVFRISRAPSASGDVYRATAQITLGDRRILPILRTDLTGFPETYTVTVRSGTTLDKTVEARARPGVFSLREHTPTAEGARDIALPARAAVLDEEVFHQYFFVALAGPGPLAIVVPRANAKIPCILTRHDQENLIIGGLTVSAVHWVLAPTGAADRPTRDFWVDAAGRVLRVSIPDRSLVVQREALPIDR